MTSSVTEVVNGLVVSPASEDPISGNSGAKITLDSPQPISSVNRRKRSRVTAAPVPQPTSSTMCSRSDDCQSDSHDIEILLTSKLHPDLRDIILTYVPSESVVHCLELAGFTSPSVLACLGEAEIRHLESFVGHACSFIDQAPLREKFLGPIFSQFPEQFRLPTGVVCGLKLAVSEIRKLHCADIHMSRSSSTQESLPVSGFVDVACQTVLTLPSDFVQKTCVLRTDQKCSSPNSISPQHVTASTSLDSDPGNFLTAVASLHNQTTVSSDIAAPSVAMMAAAFQAAAVAAVTNGTGYSSKALTLDNALFSSPAVGNPGDMGVPLIRDSNSPSKSISRLSTSLANGNFSTPLNSTGLTQTPIMYEEEMVDVDKLKHHASTNAIRLASRQFLNAHLIRGRDFDIEMETTTTVEGVKRVTGIFFCHLCRKKRERTSAVRFSIARNRYPVLSNVLSHLKTHFQYRGQLYSNPRLTNEAQGNVGFAGDFISSAHVNTPSFSSSSLTSSFPDFRSDVRSSMHTVPEFDHAPVKNEPAEVDALGRLGQSSSCDNLNYDSARNEPPSALYSDHYGSN